MKYLGLLVALVIMTSLCVGSVANADDSKWVKTSMGMVYLDKTLPGYQMLGSGAKATAEVTGYGNPYQVNTEGKNLDTTHWLAYNGQVTLYNNWFSYRASETMGNQNKTLPINLKDDTWYTLPVGK